MIELRWLEKTGFGGSPVKVLQYRQQVDTTVRAGMWNASDVQRTANWQMSPWSDVPTAYEQTNQSIGDHIKQGYNRCSKCNMELPNGPIGYVCPHAGCPTGLGSSTSL